MTSLEDRCGHSDRDLRTPVLAHLRAFRLSLAVVALWCSPHVARAWPTTDCLGGIVPGMPVACGCPAQAAGRWPLSGRKGPLYCVRSGMHVARNRPTRSLPSRRVSLDHPHGVAVLDSCVDREYLSGHLPLSSFWLASHLLQGFLRSHSKRKRVDGSFN
jgi:hypothetical protein